MPLQKFNHEITWTPALTGACAIDVGVPYPDATHEICLAADAVLFAVGHPNTMIMTQLLQAQQGLLLMRKSLIANVPLYIPL
jgi:3-isopropylmalate dehydrogenase